MMSPGAPTFGAWPARHRKASIRPSALPGTWSRPGACSRLCEADAHRALDLDGHFVFVNLDRGQRLAPLRPETVYDLVTTPKRRLGAEVPRGWTPHWFRHSHASALLLSGAREHVVMRRLGHEDIQTTLNLYGWVNDDAELAALAHWRSYCARWRGLEAGTADG